MTQEMMRIEEQIAQQIMMWKGTVHGMVLKNMVDRGASLEEICEVAGIELEEEEDD